MMSINNQFRYIGFCGADDSVDPNLLQVISVHYPWVEWGVLFRSDLQGTARYGSLTWVNQLSLCTKATPMNLAAHLCNDQCQMILEGKSEFVSQLYALGFRRVQINPTRANGVIVETAQLATVAENIRSCMNDLKNIEWIFQLNEETMPIWTHLSVNLPSNVSVLHDPSCGKGIEIQHFPDPKLYGPNVASGYAGGINPTNMRQILTAVHGIVDPNPTKKTVWIDMESSLRTMVVEKEGIHRDIFDINKCMKCIDTAVALGMPKILGNKKTDEKSPK
jgi:hypothetical protein